MNAPDTVFSSLWLLAEAGDDKDFAAIVDALAGRHGAPRFHPHMTLLGDIPQPPEALIGATEAIARAAQPFTLPVDDVVSGTAYFRSFYAAFTAGAELLTLRAAAERLIMPAGAPFVPHVSLLYGAVEAVAKAQSTREMNRRLRGRSIRFDRLALTNSANDVPLKDWRMINIVPFGRSA